MKAKGGTNLKFKRIAAFAIAVLLLLPISTLTVSANDPPTPPDDLDGEAICLYDVTHKRFIVSKNADKLLNTSTSAKVMMGLVACEALSSRLEEKITVTSEMLQGVSGYSMKLSAGEQIRIIDLLYGAICSSYNDAAYVLAYVSFGSVEGFVSEMNRQASELGASSTRYTNPVGYPDNASMVTTLTDTLKIALTASQNELYMEICSAVKHEVPSTNIRERTVIYNRNCLVSSKSTALYYDKTCFGMNAGMSGQAGGWSIITLAKDDGAEYICIVLGGTESEDGSKIYAYETVNKLVSWAQQTYNNYTVFKSGSEVGKVKIGLTALGSAEAVCVTVQDLYAYIPNHANPDLTYSIELTDGELTAPVYAGDIIGTVKVYCNGELAGECEITLTEDYEVNGVMVIIDKIGSYTKSRAFVATLVCFAVLITASLIIRKRKNSYYGKKY